jgi:hypothetical protein
MSLRHINRFHSDAAAARKTRLPVSNRCLCGTYKKTAGIKKMSLRHIQQDCRFQTDVSPPHTTRLPVTDVPAAHITRQPIAIRCDYGACCKTADLNQINLWACSKTAGLNQTSLRRIQRDYRLQSYAAATHTARLPV